MYGDIFPEVAIPSKWGLLSYGVAIINVIPPHQSQSLLNEVFFPTTNSNIYWDGCFLMSQSLLNEVFFPTEKNKEKTTVIDIKSQSLLNEVFFPTKRRPRKTGNHEMESQSLLNEVFFPTQACLLNLFSRQEVAIPSKWGLLSYAIFNTQMGNFIRRNPF